MKENKFLVDNAAGLYKSFSVILGVVIAILSLLEVNQQLITTILSQVLPEAQFATVTGVISVLLVIGRYIKQFKTTNVN